MNLKLNIKNATFLQNESVGRLGRPRQIVNNLINNQFFSILN